SLKLGHRKLRHFPGPPCVTLRSTLCDTSIEPGPVRSRRQRLDAAASAGRFSNATHMCQSQALVAAATDSAIELELDPTPCCTTVVVKPSVSVCVLGPNALDSPLASARAELPLTITSMSICFWMSTSSAICTSLANSIANASRAIFCLLLLSSPVARRRGRAWRRRHPQGKLNVA